VTSAPETTGATLKTAAGKRCRRLWSPDEKRRIVEEACRPGASVADIARYHGLNANLLFNWRKAALASPVATAAEIASSAVPLPSAASAAAGPAEFIPIGVLGRADDEGPALVTVSSPAVAQPSAARAALARRSMEERPGVIEIDLPDGTRLRVDAFVNERTLRRVLSVLKAVS
jgi:transposase